MADNAGVRVHGLRETIRTLQRFGADVADLRDAMRAAGQIVAGEAGRRVPRLSGRLAASIRPGGGKAAAVIRAGGASVPYAGVIHYGGYHNITAQPFLTDALAARRGDVVAEVTDQLGDLIRKHNLNP